MSWICWVPVVIGFALGAWCLVQAWLFARRVREHSDAVERMRNALVEGLLEEVRSRPVSGNIREGGR